MIKGALTGSFCIRLLSLVAFIVIASTMWATTSAGIGTPTAVSSTTFLAFF